MNNLSGVRRWRSRAAVFLASFLCLMPVWSDDTDIFFGDIDDAQARPNVLFIIDTSGSMNGNVSGSNMDRLDNVKQAFSELLSELNNVNVGLMRFTNPGGPVLHPVSYIDGDVNAGSIISTTASIEADTDDAQEVISTGSMILDRDELQVVELTQGTLLSFYDRVSEGDDDAEEQLTGSNYYSGTQLDFLGADPPGGDNHYDQMVGVRFSGSNVPEGATVTNAFVRFTGRNDGNSEPVYVRIQGEARDSGDFSGIGSGNLNARGKTASYVDWNLVDTVAADQTVDTPNIASIVQEIVNHSSWDPEDGGEDDMVFFFRPQPTAAGSGERDFFSRNGSSSRAPELYIEYYDGPAPSADMSKVGLRFQNLKVPRGVTITNAYLQFTAERDFTTTYDLSIGVENVGNSATFSAAAGDISSRSLFGTQVAWSGTMTKSSGETFDSPDLSGIIENVSGRNDWCGGNAMTLVVSGSDGEMPVWAHEGSGSLAPQLVVQYEYDSIDPGNSCIRRSITRNINSPSDDGEEDSSDTSAYTTGTQLDFDDDNIVGVRYTDIGIPRNADILDAYITFTAREDDGGDTSLEFYSEATDDATTYSGDAGVITSRSYNGAKVTWSITEDWDDEDEYRSPDLSALVEAVTDRAGWEPGNSLAFKLVTPNNPNRRAKSFNDSPADSPRLRIEFVDDGSGFASRKTRDVLIDLVNDLNHNGWTPIQDTLYEAALYYRGELAEWGKSRGVSGIDGGPFNYARVSSELSLVPGTFTHHIPDGCSLNNPNDSDCRWEEIQGAARYQTPITDFCQKQNHIIMLTDGEANRPHSKSLIKSMIGESSCENRAGGEECVKELVNYLQTTDQSPLQEDQFVITHTIGFNFSSSWLEDVATAGGGTYATADNATELKDKIEEIVGEMLKTNSTFVAPVAAVNEFNQLSHLNQVYFAVFRPDEFPRWPGNLKKYSLGGERGSVIVDAEGDPAIDPSTGFFHEDAISYWSASPDGSAIDQGGAAENRPDWDSRNLYTHYAGSVSSILSHSANAIDSNNGDLTKAMFDVSSMSDADFADHIDWVRGRDVDNEDENAATSTRYYYGDPLHSRPVAITYGGTEENPDVEVFFGTNAGVIQAVDASTGVETFAFMPESLLPMQRELRTNSPTTRHLYGMDGTITPWTNDNGRDGIDASDADDFVRIYTGMRRGGREYYALDVTDRANPELMWTIQGGQVQSNGDDFSELGQTWSRMIKTRILLDGDAQPREVLIFSGGYDEAQDEAQFRTDDSMGRALYIVDAVTGSLIWSGGKAGLANMTESFADMKWSLPSTPSVIDVNQDGLADAFFIADTGGQLWRFDIRNGQSLADLVTGGVIADLGVASGTNSIENNRRFFGSPSIALVRGPGGPELAISIGSGFRPSPLSIMADNRMYMIRQSDVFTPPASYTRVLESDLYDASSNTLATATGQDLIDERESLANAGGWFFNLTKPGEKVLSSPLIANDRIVFTTYVPGSSGIWCRPAAGTSYAYAVGLEDAVRDEEPQVLRTPSIVDQATIIVPPESDLDLLDPNEPGPDDPNGPEDPNGPGNVCPNGNSLVIKLNTEDGPIDNWCNDSSKTYWQKLR